MSAPPSMIEVIDIVVASEKKLKIICPDNKYTGKFGMSNLKKFEKTAVSTIIINKGFNKLHK